MKNNFVSRLLATVEHSKHIEYDENRLFDAIIYFCYHQLKHIDPNHLPEIYIEIGTEYCEDMEHNGTTFTFSENCVFIGLSPKNIKEQSEAGFCYKSPLKSLFHVFLHEFHHLLVLIDLYLKYDGKINIELIGDQRHKESVKERKKLKRQGIDSDEIWLNTPKEHDCEWFAFQNLGLLENLYEHDFLYVPRKAFMTKIKKVKRNPPVKKTQNVIEMVQPAQSQ